MVEINRGYLQHILSWGTPSEGPSSIRRFVRSIKPLAAPYRATVNGVALSRLVAWAKMFTSLLTYYKAAKGEPVSDLYTAVLENVPTFNRQYPFHFYPLLAKSFELAYLKKRAAAFNGGRVLELAIGEGSLSSKVFSDRRGVVALDLNPYSIGQTREMPHIGERVIADCIVPPLRAGTFDLLVSNNFLHHVTDKDQVLERWARISSSVLFNDNTPGWSACFMTPLRLRAERRDPEAAIADRDIREKSLQFLVDEQELDRIVSARFTITDKFSFFDRSTYAMATFFSDILGIYGPPTPLWLKRLTRARGGEHLLEISQKLAELLVLYDFHQRRTDDVFVSYLAKSKSFERGNGSSYCCPKCSAELAYGENCRRCGASHPVIGGMWFLLPDEFQRITKTVDLNRIAQLDPEHL